jgi:type III pantothenate kinase
MFSVDIGNTFTRVAAFAGDAIRARLSFHTRDLDLAELMRAFNDMKPVADGGGVWAASVSPGVNAVVDSAAERCGLARHFIHPAAGDIMPHTLKTPETTGVDRLLAALAAGRRYFADGAPGRGYVVVQCGTAATVDLVDGGGVFGGGYIMPGPPLWLKGGSIAAQLPDLSSELPDWGEIWVGDNTRDAILRGMQVALPVAVATAALLITTKEQGIVSGGAGLPVVVTGGWGEAVLPYLRAHHHYDKDLLLHGIRFFAERYA